MHMSMEIYPRTAAERAMKLPEVLSRATAGKIKWWQAAEIIGISQPGVSDREFRHVMRRLVCRKCAEKVAAIQAESGREGCRTRPAIA